MKKSIAAPLLAAFLAAPVAAQAAPSQLFFSEYVEGTSYNKALEIFNGTGAAINLATGNYSVKMFFNGSATSGHTINLTGTVSNGDVFVLAIGGTADLPTDSSILAQADQIDGNNSWFNGDDAVVLYMGTTIIDVIGQIGFDPGTEWGTGLESTYDNTLRRKSSVLAGDTDGTNAFDPSLEWIGFATNTFDGLGSHSVDAVPVPATLALLGIGLAGLGIARRRKAH